MKICSICGKEKDEKFFVKNRNQCKDCKKDYQKRYYQENSEQLKIYQKEYNIENKEYVNGRSREYRNEPKEHLNEISKKYQKDNKDRIRKQKREYIRERRRTDPNFKLRNNVSRLIAYLLETNSSSKNGESCLQYLPYTIDELKFHLEALFESWMTWKNWGVYDSKIWDDNDSNTWRWQIDHIIPHSTFKYTSMDSQEFRDCWALSNLRPLSAKRNVIDGNRRDV